MAYNTGRYLKMAARQLTKNFDQFARQYDLTSTQMSIIYYLGRRTAAQILQRDIEQEFNIRRSTATLILQRMEKKGLLQRFVAHHDARQKMVQLTAKGQELITLISQYMASQQADLEQHFGTTRIREFEEVLQYYLNLEGDQH